MPFDAFTLKCTSALIVSSPIITCTCAPEMDEAVTFYDKIVQNVKKMKERKALRQIITLPEKCLALITRPSKHYIDFPASTAISEIDF